MTTPKVPVLSREDAEAILDYAKDRIQELRNSAARAKRRRDALSFLDGAEAVGQFALALANAARKG